MRAFFRLSYAGIAGTGAGALALVDGKIAGLDVTGNPLVGTYSTNNGTLVGNVDLVAVAPGNLVTGAPLKGGQRITIPLRVDLRELEGHSLQVPTPTGPVVARLTKVADL